MTYIVALTGGIGSGKSTIADMFATLGTGVVDADLIAREVVEPDSPALNRIVLHFGHRVLQADGSLNRRWLRERIFQQPAEKNWLNTLLHPLIQQKTRIRLAAVTSTYALWVIPLLVENQRQHEANRILVADIPEKIQIHRTMQRDGISRQQAENILANQASRHARLALADDIIDNSQSQQTVRMQVKHLHADYLQRAALALQQETP